MKSKQIDLIQLFRCRCKYQKIYYSVFKEQLERMSSQN